MAFSTTSYANSGALQFPSSEMITPTNFQDDAFDLAAQLQNYFQDDGNTFFDLSTNHEIFLYDQENYSGFLPYFSTPQAENYQLASSSPDIFACEDLELTKCLKRQKCYDNYYNYDLGSCKASPLYGYAQNLSPLEAPELSPDSLIAPLQLQVPQVLYTQESVKTGVGGYVTGPFGQKTSSDHSCCKLPGRLIYPPGQKTSRELFLEFSATTLPPERFLACPDGPTRNPPVSGSKSSGNGVSAQSIAARQRRKKITEKTLELSKLIPGGSKMNTAEMLQAAFNYLKFMQAQVGILESMGSFQSQEEHKPKYDPEKDEAKRKLQALVTSPTIQEKLYSKEKCLVPTKFVKALAKDHDLHSISSALNTLNHQLVPSGQMEINK